MNGVDDSPLLMDGFGRWSTEEGKEEEESEEQWIIVMLLFSLVNLFGRPKLTEMDRKFDFGRESAAQVVAAEVAMES